MNEIRAISLDLDDTLWPIGPVIERAEHAVQSWLAAECPRVAERYTLTRLREVRNDVMAENPDRLHDLSFLRRLSLARCIEGEGYASSAVDEAFAVFYAARNDVELYEDVLPALERLAKEFVLVAISNGNANLAAVGLDGYFSHSLHASDIGAAKPDPAMFEAALERTGLGGHEVLHVGDDPAADVLGAQRAGLYAAWLNRGGGEWRVVDSEPHMELATLYDLLRALNMD